MPSLNHSEKMDQINKYLEKLEDRWYYNKRFNIHAIWVLEGYEEKKGQAEKKIQRILCTKLSKFGKNINLQIKEMSETSAV